MKKLTFLFVMLTIALIATSVYATTDGLHSTETTVRINDRDFNPWGYICARRSTALRLQDMAYMLNGTPAQFAMRTPPNDRWDYWIILGEPYVPTGAEFRPIPEERFAWAGDGFGYMGWEGFDTYPIRPIIIGVGGRYEPETSVALIAIRDVDYAHFSMYDLSHLLGFYLVYNRHYHWWDDHWPYHNIVIDTSQGAPAVLPMQEPELARILARLSYRDHGHWVDVVHLYGEEIDEAVVWPAEFRVCPSGFSVLGPETVAPFIITDRWDWQEREQSRFRVYPMEMRTLESGYIELTVAQPEIPTIPWNARPTHDIDLEPRQARFYNYRIVVDPAQYPILNVSLHIGDVAHSMYSHRFAMHFAGRSQAIPAYGGGIILRYVLHWWEWANTADNYIRVYRSYTEDQRGMQLHSQDGITDTDSLLYEFADPTAEWGQIYYYRIFANERQVFKKRVDTAEILDEPYVPYEPYEPYELYIHYEPYEPYELCIHYEPCDPVEEHKPVTMPSRLWLLVIVPIVAVGVVLAKKFNR